MRIGVLGDLHARWQTPSGRKDDYLQTFCGKLTQAFRIFREQRCQIVIQPGDLFDSPRPGNALLHSMITWFNGFGLPIRTVLGQHDTYYHDINNPERTPSGVLEAAGVVRILTTEPQRFAELVLYGASYGQEVPMLRRHVQDEAVRILVAHASVGDKPLFPGHKLSSPVRYVQAHQGYNLIVLGDYHYRFVQEVAGTWIVNMGSLMRMRNSVRDREHIPAVGVFGTTTKEMQTFPLDVIPAEQVFKEMPEAEPDEPSQALESFLQKLRTTGELGVSFLDNLNALLEARRTSRAVRLVLSDIVESTGIGSNDTRDI